jgi:hypothetical protein
MKLSREKRVSAVKNAPDFGLSVKNAPDCLATLSLLPVCRVR